MRTNRKVDPEGESNSDKEKKNTYNVEVICESVTGWKGMGDGEAGENHAFLGLASNSCPIHSCRLNLNNQCVSRFHLDLQEKGRWDEEDRRLDRQGL